MPDLVRRINDSGATILFLALGSPRQEKWFATHAPHLLHVKVCQGIGGTLDTIAGTVKRAPAVWQKLSAEWLYRLLSEPKRIDLIDFKRNTPKIERCLQGRRHAIYQHMTILCLDLASFKDAQAKLLSQR